MGDEEEPTAAVAMRHVAEQGGVAPRIWWYELRNALLVNERRGRISRQQVSDTLNRQPRPGHLDRRPARRLSAP